MHCLPSLHEPEEEMKSENPARTDEIPSEVLL